MSWWYAACRAALETYSASENDKCDLLQLLECRQSRSLLMLQDRTERERDDLRVSCRRRREEAAVRQMKRLRRLLMLFAPCRRRGSDTPHRRTLVCNQLDRNSRTAWGTVDPGRKTVDSSTKTSLVSGRVGVGKMTQLPSEYIGDSNDHA